MAAVEHPRFNQTASGSFRGNRLSCWRRGRFVASVRSLPNPFAACEETDADYGADSSYPMAATG